MTKMKALTFKEKDQILKQLFSQYQKAKVRLECIERMDFYPSIDFHTVRETKATYHVSMVSRLNSYIEDKDELRRLVVGFEQILSYISPQAREIIEHEYLYHTRKNWWIEYYSKSTFYRAKNKAMEEMLFYLNL